MWAIQDYGFQAVIAPSFADIFRGNSGNAGLLLAEVSRETAEQLWEGLRQHPERELTVDLESQTVLFDGMSATFEINQHTRHKLLNGLDDIEITMARSDDIEAFELQRPVWRPRI